MKISTRVKLLQASSIMNGVLRNILTTGILVFHDLFLFLAGLQLAILIRAQILPRIIGGLPIATFDLGHYLNLWWLPLVWLLILAVEGLYNHRFTLWDEVRILWRGNTLAALAVFAIVGLGKLSSLIERTTITLLWGILLFLLPLGRVFIKRLLPYLHLWRKDILILGAARTGRMVLRAIQRDPVLGYRVVGFLDDDPQKQGQVVGRHGNHEIRVLGPLSEASRLLEEGLARDVVIAMPGLPQEKLIDLVHRLQGLVETIRLVPNIWLLPMMEMRIDHFLHERAFMVIIANNLAKPWNIFLKRAFDLIVGSLITLVTLPVMGFIALLIRLDSPGPVFYIHERLGRGGRIFRCYKFRSMYVDGDERLEEYLNQNPQAREEWERYKKLKTADPRVTAVGRLLRRWSIDELPQLFNVLKGDMSLVGARPYLPREWEDIGPARGTILATWPGMTGLWQVSGKNELPFEERVRMEAWYVRNWSLWLDLIILIRTVKTVLGREGAY